MSCLEKLRNGYQFLIIWLTPPQKLVLVMVGHFCSSHKQQESFLLFSEGSNAELDKMQRMTRPFHRLLQFIWEIASWQITSIYLVSIFSYTISGLVSWTQIVRMKRKKNSEQQQKKISLNPPTQRITLCQNEVSVGIRLMAPWRLGKKNIFAVCLLYFMIQ